MYDPDTEYGQPRLVRLLNTTWPLLRAFRVDVRVSWTILIWPVLFTASFLDWLPFGEALLWGVAWTIAIFTVVWTHEMGHIGMGRRLGIDSQTMTLRGLGGLAHLDSPAQNPRDEILIALAGPATHLVWMAVLYPFVWWLESAYFDTIWYWMLWGLARLQLWLMVFNLLPVYPLDGGRVLRGALSFRMHSTTASYHVSTIGFIGNGAFIVLGLLSWLKVWDPFGVYGFIMVWLGFWGIQMNRQLRMQARHGEIYAAPDPYARALLASQAVGRAMDREEERAERRREALARKRAELRAEVDRLLDRVSESGGVDALSPRERRRLVKASQRLKELGR